MTVIMMSLWPACLSAQKTTYFFTSVRFNTFSNGGSCPPSCQITGFITLEQPLPPNLTSQHGIGGSGDLIPTSFSFTDGVITLTESNVDLNLGHTVGFSFTTDDHANIKSYSFYMERTSTAYAADIAAYYDGSGNDSEVGIFNAPYDAYFEGLGVPPGTWTESMEVRVNDQLVNDLTLKPSVPGLTGHRRQPQLIKISCPGSDPQRPMCQPHIAVRIPDKTSGGHAQSHDFQSRPPGELSTDASELEDGTSLNSTDADLDTNASDGSFSVYFLPSIVGGDVILKVTDRNQNGGLPDKDVIVHVTTTAPSTAGVNLATPSHLTALPPGVANYQLTGSTSVQNRFHSDNHYGTPLFLSTLSNISENWFNPPIPYRPVPPLAINDMSLIDGGVFDLGKPVGNNPVQADWKPSHHWHRWGDEADIGSGGPLPPDARPGQKPITYWLPPSQRQRLRMILLLHGYEPIKEEPQGVPCDPFGDDSGCTHYHIRPIGVR